MARLGAIVFVAAAATGCYSPSYVDCEVTCASGSCPDGLSCRLGLCRLGDNAGACVGPGSDSGPTDGVTDAPSIDAPPGVADEDSDLLLDNVDPCPISANNADMDSDGLGDACESLVGGVDTLILFEGFHGTTAPTGAQVMGNWTFSGGSARVISGANVASSVTFAITTSSAVRTTVVAKVRIEAPLISTADPTSAGPVSRTDGNSNGIACALGFNPTTSADSLMLLKLAAGADATFRTLGFPAGANTTNVLSVSRNPVNDSFSCFIEANAVGLIPPTPIPTGTRVGIRSRSMNASFEWVMVYETR